MLPPYHASSADALPNALSEREGDGHQRPTRPLISLVLPVFNERLGLPLLLEDLQRALSHEATDYELIFVDDGSRDGSNSWLSSLSRRDERVTVIHFSRNFGHQAAVQAGIAESRGDVVVVMDSDLQDDPAAIARFVEAWRAGFDVVYAVRTQRKEGWLKRLLFSAFYRVMQVVSTVSLPVDAGNFGLIDRRVADALNALPEQERYFAGLRSWLGYRSTGVLVERRARYDGRPRVSLAGLFSLAKRAVFGFSRVPVLLLYGFAASLAAVTLGLLAAMMASPSLRASLGSPGLLMAITGVGTLNAIGLALVGDYLYQILQHVRGRPTYVIDRVERGRSRARPRREVVSSDS